MICLCMKLQMLNYMRYRTDKGICKLTAEQYNHKIFDGEPETEQEFSDTAWTMNPALADDPDAGLFRDLLQEAEYDVIPAGKDWELTLSDQVEKLTCDVHRRGDQAR